MKLGIFGCTADPFTIAHRAIVEKVLSDNLVDKVVILPTAVTYYREDKKQWLGDNSKIVCINRMIENSRYRSRIIVDRFELDLKIISPEIVSDRRSYHMVSDIKNKYDADEYYYIIGTDSYRHLKTWYRYDDLIKMIDFIVVDGRDGDKVGNIEYPVISIDDKYSNVSASEIRDKFSNLDEYLAIVAKQMV